MNPALPPRIARLAALALQPARRVIGLMSGTSLDGLDIALCTIAGAGPHTRVTLERFLTRPYSPAERERLRTVVSRPEASLADVCILNAWLAETHARAVLAALAEWGVPVAEVDLLASHGQTVFHAPGSWRPDGDARGPARHATLQLGDGDLLALRTGLLTVSDFRQKEIAGGGQGAPLAPYAESLLYRGPEARVLLNLGGIANFTWLPPLGSAAPVRSGDTGPANTLLDRAARSADPDGPGFDANGAGAARGAVDGHLLARLKAHPYFALPCPKSTGPELFGAAYLAEALERAGERAPRGADLLATLTRLTVDTIAETLRREVPRLSEATLYVSGGGRHNGTLMRGLAEALPEMRLADAAALGIPPDAKEAVLFAVLGNEAVAGPGFAVPVGSAPAGGTVSSGAPDGLPDRPTGSAGHRIAFGKLSFPD